MNQALVRAMRTQVTVDSCEQAPSNGDERRCIDSGILCKNVSYELIYIASWSKISGQYSICFIATLLVLHLESIAPNVSIYLKLAVAHVTWNIPLNHMLVSWTPFKTKKREKSQGLGYKKTSVKGNIFKDATYVT